MKILKNYLIIILFCVIISTYAKRTGTAQAPVSRPPQSIQEQIQPQIKTKTFKQMVDAVKTAPTSMVWNTAQQKLQSNFIDNLIKDVRNANLKAINLEILLKIARDTHAQFTGNDNQDVQILTSINSQINDAKIKII